MSEELIDLIERENDKNFVIFSSEEKPKSPKQILTCSLLEADTAMLCSSARKITPP